jgi:ATP-dependent HslUV protease subunit HslV
LNLCQDSNRHAANQFFELNGDVLEPEDGIIGIGSGGNFALASARALADSNLSAYQIVEKSLKIAADLCVYTNRNIIIDQL